jgi:prevent-host-death family protein
MMVGTKTLKNRLSYYLRRVSAGETVTVTDRGTPIAELRAVKRRVSREIAALQFLTQEGLLTPGTGRYAGFSPLRLKNRAHLSDAVLEDRR